MELVGMLAIALFKLNAILRSHSNSTHLSDLDGLQSRTQQQLCHILSRLALLPPPSTSPLPLSPSTIPP